MLADVDDVAAHAGLGGRVGVGVGAVALVAGGVTSFPCAAHGVVFPLVR